MTMSVDSAASPDTGERPDDPAASSGYDTGRAEQATMPQPGGEDTGGQRRAETLTREEYADAVRGRRHDARADGGSLSAVSRDATGRAPAYDVDAGQPPDGDAAAPAVTHFHGEFKGRPLDLYTDGTRWAAADTPDTDETVSEKDDMPDRPPTGAELVDNADKGSSLLERLRREVYEESDDEIDVLEKDANLVYDVFSRPPTGSYEGTLPNQPYIHGTQHSGIDAGSVATAVFTLGLVIDRTARWAMQHYENHAKGR